MKKSKKNKSERRFDAKNTRIQRILFSSNIKYRIPQFQREYTWGPSQMDDFWEDLNNEESSSFLGSIIVNYEEYDERPFHLYGQYYCSEETIWNDELDLCLSDACNGDLNEDEVKNITDIILLVNEVLNEQGCE